MDCIFCKIVNKDINADILFENDFFIVFSDIKPSAEIHKLIVPKRHIDNLLSFNDAEVLEYWSSLVDTINIVSDLLKTKDFKIVVNNGNLQQVKHLHIHFLSGMNVNDKVN